MEVSNNNVRVVLIACVAIVGLALAAAALPTISSPGLSGGGPDLVVGDSPENVGGDTEDSTGGGGQAAAGGSQSSLNIPKICIPVLTNPIVILGIVVGIVSVVVGAYWYFGFVAAAFSGYLLGIPAVLGYGLLTQCGSPAGGGGGQSGVMGFIGGSGGDGVITSFPVPPIVLIGVFGVVAVLAVSALVSVSGSDELDPVADDDEEQMEEPGLEQFAEIAGTAADRIESTDETVDNAVYQAWQDMTDLLSLSGADTKTPGEFAVAAVGAGLNENDVAELTTLFEEVRYGEMDPEPRESLAVRTLRSIEETYDLDEQ